MWFIGVELEKETSAPPPKRIPGSAPDVKPKSYKNLIKHRDKMVTKLKKYMSIIQKMKVKNLRSKNTKIKYRYGKKKKRVLKMKVKNHRLL